MNKCLNTERQWLFCQDLQWRKMRVQRDGPPIWDTTAISPGDTHGAVLDFPKPERVRPHLNTVEGVVGASTFQCGRLSASNVDGERWWLQNVTVIAKSRIEGNWERAGGHGGITMHNSQSIQGHQIQLNATINPRSLPFVGRRKRYCIFEDSKSR